MIKQAVKTILGKKNVDRIKRIKKALNAARNEWRNTAATFPNTQDRTAVWCLMQIHQIEKAMAVEHAGYMKSVKYSPIIAKLKGLLHGGMSPQDFTIRECAAVINSALGQVSGHDDERSEFEAFISENNIPLNFRGGVERIPSTEIFEHNNFDFNGFVSSRHSVRRFKDKIISCEAHNKCNT